MILLNLIGGYLKYILKFCSNKKSGRNGADIRTNKCRLFKVTVGSRVKESFWKGVKDYGQNFIFYSAGCTGNVWGFKSKGLQNHKRIK